MVSFALPTKGKYEIAKEALAKKKALYLNPPVGFIGCRGFEKFILELPKWRDELPKEDYDKILFNMVQFFGTVQSSFYGGSFGNAGDDGGLSGALRRLWLLCPSACHVSIRGRS